MHCNSRTPAATPPERLLWKNSKHGLFRLGAVAAPSVAELLLVIYAYSARETPARTDSKFSAADGSVRRRLPRLSQNGRRI
jgi:hypothetical protein